MIWVALELNQGRRNGNKSLLYSDLDSGNRTPYALLFRFYYSSLQRQHWLNDDERRNDIFKVNLYSASSVYHRLQAGMRRPEVPFF